MTDQKERPKLIERDWWDRLATFYGCVLYRWNGMPPDNGASFRDPEGHIVQIPGWFAVLLEDRRAENARLTAPPGASAMEEAKIAFREAQRSHLLSRKNLAICEEEAVARAIEASERRARAAMREEVAQMVAGWTTANFALHLSAAIRALPLDPPREKTMQERFNDGDMPAPSLPR